MMYRHTLNGPARRRPGGIRVGVLIVLLSLTACSSELQDAKELLAEGSYAEVCVVPVTCREQEESCIQRHEVRAQACHRSNQPTRLGALTTSKSAWETALTLLPADAEPARRLTPAWGYATTVKELRDNTFDLGAARLTNTDLMDAGALVAGLPGGERAGAYFQANALQYEVVRRDVTGNAACTQSKRANQLLDTLQPAAEPDEEAATLDELIRAARLTAARQVARECPR